MTNHNKNFGVDSKNGLEALSHLFKAKLTGLYEFQSLLFFFNQHFPTSFFTKTILNHKPKETSTFRNKFGIQIYFPI